MREYLLVLCVAAAVTYLLTPLARRLAVRTGAMAEPRDRDVHAIPTPRLGGLAMYGGVAAAFLVAHELPALQTVFTYSDVQAVVLAGVCLGFLPHNFNPARIFMGDSGSMLIGLMLAGSVTSLMGQFDYSNLPPSTAFPVLLPLLLPLAVLAVPIVDLLLAVGRRTRAGRSPFAPDKAHLHHRLLEIGHSHTRAVLIMYFWTALLAFGGVAVAVTGGVLPVLAVTGVIAALALVASSVPRLRAARALDQ